MNIHRLIPDRNSYIRQNNVCSNLTIVIFGVIGVFGMFFTLSEFYGYVNFWLTLLVIIGSIVFGGSDLISIKKDWSKQNQINSEDQTP